MNVKKLRVGLLLTALAAGCAGPTYQLKLKPYQLDAVDFRLPSGLRVVFQEDKSQPSVMVVSIIDVGSSQEPPGKEGMAHLIEHLCFRAVHGNRPKVWDLLKQIGAGFYNASTYLDWTDYMTLAPKEHLQTLLEIEAMRMIDPLAGVTQADLDAEREIVRNELRLRVENSPAKAYLYANEMLYPPDHPYHRDTIGTHDSLDNITMKDIQDYVKKYYVPENFTIVVAGDFDRSQASQILARSFPRSVVAKPGTPPDAKIEMIEPIVRVKGKAAEPPAPVNRGPKRIKAPVTNPVVVLAWSLPGGYRENQALMEITAATMDSAIGSLLYPGSSEERDRKVEGLGCGADPNAHATTVYCWIELSEGQDPEKIASKAIDGLWELWNAESVEGIQINDPYGEESYKLPGQRKFFEIAKGEYQAQLFRQSASLMRAIDVVHYMHFTGRPDYFTARINEIAKVTSFDSRELAYKYLNRDRAIKLIVEPYDAKEKPVSSVAADQGSSWAGATYGSTGKGMFADYAKITPADIEKLAMAPDVASVRELTLPNGLKVFLKKHGTTPFVNVALYSHGGSATATPWGFPDFSFENFDAQNPGKIAGAWRGGALQDGELRSVETPSGNLVEALDLVYDRARTTKTNWTRRKMDRAVERYKSRLKTAEKRPEIWAGRAMSNLLFPSHPFGRQVYDIDALNKLSESDYASWLDKHLSPKNSALFVVGDIDLDDAEKKVTAMFGKWKAGSPGDRMPGFPPPPPKPSRQIAFVDDPDRTQAQITVGCHVAPATIQNDAARDVFLRLLGEDVWQAIRERAGASYGVYPYSQNSSDGAINVLYVSGAVQNDKARPALKTILDRLGEIRAGKVDQTKLNEVKWLVAANTRSDNQSPAEMMFTLVGAFREDRPLAALSGYPQRLAKVTVKDLQDVLAPCAGHEVTTIVGPEKALRPALESLKIPIETVDWRKGRDATPEVTTKASAP